MDMDRKQAIGLMLASFPASQSQAQLVALAYLTAVEKLSDFAIATAALEYVKGEVPGHDPRFAPSAAQFAIYAKRYHIADETVEFVARHPEALESGKYSERYKGEVQRRVRLLEEAEGKSLASPKPVTAELSRPQRALMIKRMTDAGLGFAVGDPDAA